MNLQKQIKGIFNRKKRKNKQRNLEALESFMRQKPSMPAGDSLRNLHQGLVEFVGSNRNHVGNGLLITRNGFLLTCRHMVDNGIVPRTIRTQTGETYTTEQDYLALGTSDIALVKARIDDAPEPMQYEFLRYTKLMPYQVLITLSRWEGRLEEDIGHYKQRIRKATGTNGENTYKKRYNDHIQYTCQTVRGDSGGITISPEGKLIGFHSGSDCGYGSAATIDSALDLINHFITERREK